MVVHELNHRRRTRVLVVAAIVLAAVSTSSAAYAYWTASGSGGGSASTAAGQNLTISPGTATSSLAPGGNGGITLTIANSNPSTAHINSLSLDTSQGSSGFAVDSGHSACTTALAALSYVTQSAGYDVSANGTLTLTLPASALSMGSNAANVCQGATFTVYLKVS